MTDAAQLMARLGADTTGLQQGLQRADGMIGGFAKTATGTLGGLAKNLLGGLAKNLLGGLVGGIGIGAGVAAFNSLSGAISGAASAAIGFNAQMETSGIAFETMLGSAEKAGVFLAELQKFAAQTPFEFPELTQAAQRMKAYGFEAQEVIPILTAVGDAASGLGAGQDGINRIVLALGQMKTTGKVLSQDMLQLTSVGIPAWDILAKSIGVSTAEVKKMVSEGLYPADKAVDALVAGMNERFGGLMEKQARTWTGALSTIKDTAQIALGTAIKPLFEELRTGAVGLADWLQSDEVAAGAQTVAHHLGNLIGMVKGGVADIRQFAGGLQESARSSQLFQQGVQLIQTAIGGVISVTGPLITSLKNLWAVVRDPAIDFLRSRVEGAFNRFKGVVEGAFNRFKGVFEGVVVPVFTGLVTLATGAIDALAALFRGDGEQAWAILREAGDGAARWIVTALVNMANLGIDTIKGLALGALDILSRVDLFNVFDRQIAGLRSGIEGISGIAMPEFSQSLDTQRGVIANWRRTFQDTIDSVKKGLTVTREEADDTGQSYEEMFEEGTEGAEDFAGGLDKASKAASKLRSTVEGLFQPSQPTDFIQKLDEMGAHIDTWDENARRMADIAARGSDSPWVSFFDIPADVLAGGEDALKLWAVRWQRSFYLGFMPNQINVEAVMDRYRELLASKQAWEGIFQEVEARIRAEGLAFDEDVLGAAFGGSSGGGGGLPTGNKIADSFRDTLANVQRVFGAQPLLISVGLAPAANVIIEAQEQRDAIIAEIEARKAVIEAYVTFVANLPETDVFAPILEQIEKEPPLVQVGMAPVTEALAEAQRQREAIIAEIQRKRAEMVFGAQPVPDKDIDGVAKDAQDRASEHSIGIPTALDAPSNWQEWEAGIEATIGDGAEVPTVAQAPTRAPGFDEEWQRITGRTVEVPTVIGAPDPKQGAEITSGISLDTVQIETGLQSPSNWMEWGANVEETIGDGVEVPTSFAPPGATDYTSLKDQIDLQMFTVTIPTTFRDMTPAEVQEYLKRAQESLENTGALPPNIPNATGAPEVQPQGVAPDQFFTPRPPTLKESLGVDSYSEPLDWGPSNPVTEGPRDGSGGGNSWLQQWLDIPGEIMRQWQETPISLGAENPLIAGTIADLEGYQMAGAVSAIWRGQFGGDTARRELEAVGETAGDYLKTGALRSLSDGSFRRAFARLIAPDVAEILTSQRSRQYAT